jgi:type II secretory pathway component PulM
VVVVGFLILVQAKPQARRAKPVQQALTQLLAKLRWIPQSANHVRAAGIL